MSGVNRYDAVHIRHEENNIRYGEGCEVEMVTASDYDRLEQECERLKSIYEEDTRRLTGVNALSDNLKAERDILRAQVEAMRQGLLAVSIVIDGDIRATVRDCVNGLPDVQDIYGYCDNIDAIITTALQAKP